MTMGDMGRLLSCLTFEVRDNISKRIGFNVSCDTNRELIYKYLYTLKDLRNAIAHNSVIFDGRFKKISITKPMRRCLEIEIGLSYVNFDTIGDYIILICYYLKLLKVSKDEIDCFISDFKEIVNDYKSLVPLEIYAKVVHVDLDSRLSILKKFI